MVNTFSNKDSDMSFINCNSFRIDMSKLYESVKSNGIKAVEFIRVKDNELLFVEAKKSLHNPQRDEKASKYFQEEIEQIRDKFIHSLNLFSSVKLGIREEVLPDDFFLPKNGNLVFVLVVKEHEIDRCKITNAALIKSLNEAMPLYLENIWNPVIKVINHEIAIEENLVIN